MLIFRSRAGGGGAKTGAPELTIIEEEGEAIGLVARPMLGCRCVLVYIYRTNYILMNNREACQVSIASEQEVGVKLYRWIGLLQ